MLELANFREHPTDDNYDLYHYFDKSHADHFEGLLREQGITYDRQQEWVEKRQCHVHLFAVGKADRKSSRYLNNLTVGKFRKPFIADKVLRYFVLFFTFLLLLLALVGWIVAKS